MRRLLFILLAAYFVLIGGGVYYNAVFAIRVFHHALMTVVLLVWLFVRLRRGDGLPTTSLNPWIYAAVALWLVTAVLGSDPRIAFESTWFLLINVLIFFALVDLFDKGRGRWLFEAQFIIGALVVLLALYQLASWYFGLGVFPGTEIGWFEVGGIPLDFINLSMPMGVSTWLAAYSAPLAVFTGAWALTSPRRDARIALGVLAGGLLLVTLLTFSRGGLIALGAAGASLFLVRVIPDAIRRRRLWIPAVIIAGMVAVVVAGVLLISRDPDRLAGDALRADLWRGAVQITLKKPFIGNGVASFGRSFRDERNPRLVDDRLSSAHNLYLNTAAELGLPGLVIGGGMMVTMGLTWLRRWRKTSDGGERFRLEAAGAALVGFAAQSMFDTFTLPAVVSLPILLAAYVVTEGRSRADVVLNTAPPRPHIRERAAGWVALVLVAGYGLLFIQSDRAQAVFNRSVAAGSLEDAHTAAEIDPSLQLYDLQVLTLTAAQTDDLQTAINSYEWAMSLEPTWDKGAINLAALYIEKGDIPEAMELLLWAQSLNYYNGSSLAWARLAEEHNAAPDDSIIDNYIFGIGSTNYLPLSSFWWETPLRRAALERHIPVLPLDRQYRVWAVHAPERLAALVPQNPVTAADWWVVGEHALTVEQNPEKAAQAFDTAVRLAPRSGDYYASRARANVTLSPAEADRDLKIALLLGTLDEYPNAIRAELAATPDEVFRLRVAALPPRVIDQNFEGVLFAGRVASFEVPPEMRPPGPGRRAMQPWYSIATDYEQAGLMEDAARVYRAILDYAPDEQEASQRLLTLDNRVSG